MIRGWQVTLPVCPQDVEHCRDPSSDLCWLLLLCCYPQPGGDGSALLPRPETTLGWEDPKLHLI